jgi:hypothetical protein
MEGWQTERGRFQGAWLDDNFLYVLRCLVRQRLDVCCLANDRGEPQGKWHVCVCS